MFSCIKLHLCAQFSTRYHYHELFEHGEKPGHCLSGLRFAGQSTHESHKARRATATVMVTAQDNWPDLKGCSPLGSAAFSHPSSYCRHGMHKDLHFYFFTHTPFCMAYVNGSLVIQLLTFSTCLLNIYIGCSNLSGRGNPKFARVKRSIYKG